MKVSTAGKALGPQSGWRCVNLDGEEVIVTPGGRILRVQQLSYGMWVANPFGASDSKHLVDGANLLREKNAAENEAEQKRLLEVELGDNDGAG